MASSPLIASLDALIVDDLATKQAVMGDLLSMIGARRAEGVSSAEAMLKALRTRRFGLVLFDTHAQSRASALPLFHYAREQGLLPLQTLVYVVSDDPTGREAVLSGEWQSDAFFLRPVTAAAMEARLIEHLQRRRVLAPVLAALDEGQSERAVATCEVLLRARGRWTLDVLELQARALMRDRRPAEAAQACALALRLRADLLWARIGLARARLAQGDLAGAHEVAQALLESDEGGRSPEALEVGSQCLEALNQGQMAVAALQRAAQLAPSPRQLRLLAECASRQGDLQAAKAAYLQLVKSTRGTLHARELDELGLMQVQMDLGELAAAQPAIEAAARRVNHGQNRRGVAMALKAQVHARLGEADHARRALERARQQADAPSLDVAGLALAKAELLAGDEAQGVQLLLAAAQQASTPAAMPAAVQVLRDTGRSDELVSRFDAEMLQLQLQRAADAILDQRLDEGVAQLVAMSQQRPDDAQVLLQAARLISVAIKLTGQDDPHRVACVRRCLERLDELMPGQDAVLQARRYFELTLQSLAARHDTPEPDTDS